MGFYGHSATPFIIGSHTSYRMSAICEIGGYQPTRAEDHLDTVVLAAHGYRGVYVPEIIATGDGPTTFGTYVGQQFAWAYSMAQILFQHTPRLLKQYRLSQAFQFLMAQTWYTLWSASCAALWAIPLVALLSGERIGTARLSEFGLHYAPMLLCATLVWWWSRSLFQPRKVTLSWRGILLEAARWPVVLWAVVNVILRIRRPYMITPKGTDISLPPGHRLYAPYFALAWIAVAGIVIYLATDGPLATAGYLWLAFFNAISVLLVVAVGTLMEVLYLQRERGAAVALRARLGTLVALLVTSAVMAACASEAAPLLGLTLS